MTFNHIVAACGRKEPSTPISSRGDFINYFRKNSWDKNVRVVLLFDELGCLYGSDSNVRNDCLQAFRGLKLDREHAVQCIIAAGTHNITYLNPPTLSPFNVADIIQSPNFTMDETWK